MVWSAWLVVVPSLAAVTWGVVPWSAGARRDLLVLWTLVGASGLLALGALLADGARPGDPRALPRRRVLHPPAVLGAVQLAVWLIVALGAQTPRQAAVVLGAAGLILAIAALSGVGVTAGIALVVGWAGWHLLAEPGTPWADVAVAVALVAAGVGVSLVPGHRRGWSRWDLPVALAGAPAALLALVRAEGANVAPVFTVVGLLVVGAAVRLGWHRRRLVLSEVLGVLGTGIILVGTGESSAGWLALALLALSAAHTALAAVRESGTARTIRQVVGALAGAAAWGAALAWLAWPDQRASDVTAVGGAVLTVLLLLAQSRGLLGRSWVTVWGATTTLLAAVAMLAVAGDGGPAWSWWHASALVLLAVAAVLVLRVFGWAPGRSVAVGLGLAALLVAFDAAGWSTAARAGLLVGLSAACAVGTVLLAWVHSSDDAAAPVRHPWLRPVTGAGMAAVVLALGVVLLSDTGLLAAPLAGATVQVAGAGVAWRKVGLRLAAPVLAWLTWAALVPEVAAGAPGSWYTLPVGLALLAVVALWRAERRSRGLAPADPPGIALELTGIAFLVVTSWVETFTVSVLHALLAAAIGVAVLLWGLITRVRRRVAAAAVVVLVSLVLAVAVPLVALLPAWGGAAVWVAVAVLGLVAVLVATLLEKGRLAVRSVAARAGAEGWE